ncbi:MAG: ribonuclease R, partial [Alphaproteobacteria bacterium]
REIARAFNIKGDDHIALKELLRQMKADGLLKGNRKQARKPGTMPPVTILDITHESPEGDLVARPVKWDGEDTPQVLVHDAPTKGKTHPGVGDRVLARIQATKGDYPYEARVMKRLTNLPTAQLGIYHFDGDMHRVLPIDRKSRYDLVVAKADLNGVKQGELVEVEVLPERQRGLKRARILNRLGKADTPARASLIALTELGIPDNFETAVIDEAKAAKQLTDFARREDLTNLPLLTIDPSDARDHDDAICAEPDRDPANQGGHIVHVAIADVAYYVTPGSALDRAAKERGNSTYFPDRVVPMLPEELSADLCSLHENALRPVMAVRMVFDATGKKLSHNFMRATMRSPASLSYEDAQTSFEGHPNEAAKPLHENALQPLYQAYRAVAQARDSRQPLDLDLPEHKINLARDGSVKSVTLRDRFDAHRLVEEFMIQANVAAAETLEKHLGRKGKPVLYRLHEAPSDEKITALHDYLRAMDVPFAKGQTIKPAHFNKLLKDTAARPEAVAMQEIVLRSQSQAVYGTDPLGHFGLNLTRYSHFTSPIRRYADLLVHRALIRALDLGADGLTDNEMASIAETAEHISTTERRSMAAERSTNDRLIAHYLSDKCGTEFEGRITGVTRAGLFVRLSDLGADGFVPMRSLGDDWFDYDEKARTLFGRSTRQTFAMGDEVSVRLLEATPIQGGLLLSVIDHRPLDIERNPRSSKGRGQGAKGPKNKNYRTRRGAPKGRGRGPRK